MDRSLRAATALVLWAAALPALPQTQSVQTQNAQTQNLPSIRRVQVLRSAGHVEIEIEGSDRIVPRANILTGPDRLIVDFVNAVPGAQLRSQAVNRAEVKSFRVGLFSSNPPVTRVVLDLNGPQPYQVFPSGRTVIVKVGAGAAVQASAARPGSGLKLITSSYSAPVYNPAPMRPVLKPLEVTFDNNQLWVSAHKANLSEVLFAIHQRTGAEIAIPAGAEQEQVVGDIGPAPAPQVLAQLLNGSKFNFLILSSSTDPGALDRVILSSRPEGPMPPPRVQAHDSDEDEETQADNPPKPSAAPPTATVEKAASATDDKAAPATDHADHSDPSVPEKPKVAGDTDIPD
jgi:AMIN domain